MSNKQAAAEWLDSYDLDECEDVGGCSGRWFDDAEKKLNVKSRSELTSSKFLTSGSLGTATRCDGNFQGYEYD